MIGSHRVDLRWWFGQRKDCEGFEFGVGKKNTTHNYTVSQTVAWRKENEAGKHGGGSVMPWAWKLVGVRVQDIISHDEAWMSCP